MLSCDFSRLGDTSPSIASATCGVSVEDGDEGTNPVSGYFHLGLNTTIEHQGIALCGDLGTPLVCQNEESVLVRHDIAGSRADNSLMSMELVLEDLMNVGDVSVARTRTDSPFSGGYTWTVTFLRDSQGAAACADGTLTGA